ncbi:MAG: filamentous hemagglutinin N-terminal domain-containing protein, partial [Oxalobacteraceae bacterium]|nr:filamentous hemagglutinin N-terminal domain-containing protein [Oxalobacteraceae bacterium]
MNHIYRIIWSQVTNAWVAVAESSRGRGKGSSRKLAAAALSLTASFAQAAPAGGEVIAGSGNIAQSGHTTTITQTSQNLSLNWQRFDITRQETVNFAQPSASAIAVNRIFDTNGSQILGRLNANGQVYLINPNGILFGQGAQVNVGALVASTLNVNDANLIGNVRQFSGAGTGSLVNLGTINAARGGYVALLGNTVSNQGTITAPLGTVALGAGNAVTLNFNGNSLVRMQVDQSVLNSLAENGGLIKADGGLVVMNAGAKNALLASVVNNTGKIEARTVENHEGTIILLGGMEAGTVHVDGTLDASAPTGGNGGFVETSAAQVNVAGNVKITTAAPAGTVGHWLIDPVDFTIATTGGDISGTDLGNLLASNSITVQTASGTNAAGNLYGATGSNGDIHVNDTVSWASSNTLTLDAWRNININKSITATGASGKLALKYGQGATDGVMGEIAATYNVNASVNLKAGNNFSTQLGSTGSVKNYTVITSLGTQGSTTATDLQGISGGLASNFVLGGNIDASMTSTWNAGAGFTPIGLETTTVDYGHGPYTSTQTTPFTGIFDGLGHTISNLSINQSGVMNLGLIGETGSSSVIRNLGIQGGSIMGQQQVGPLVGTNRGKVINAYATADVTGSSYLGGLVGLNFGSISNSYATGNVSGNGSYVAGLTGGVFNGSVDNSYATGNVNGNYMPAGLVGYLNHGSINNSYAAGRINSTSNTASGLVGLNEGAVSNSYWNITTSGQTGSSGGIGLTTAEMQTAANFAGFNFTGTPGATGNNWIMVDADGSLNNAGGSPGSTRPMLASEYSTTINNVHQLQLMAMAPGANYALGANVNAATTGLIGGIITDVWGNAGFVPVGNRNNRFSGTFDGNGHTIAGLYINSTATDVGLIGSTSSSAIVRNVGMVGGSVTSTGYVIGSLVGLNSGLISSSYATGDVSGRGLVGGLVGIHDNGSIEGSYATGNVHGTDGSIGGLVGALNSVRGNPSSPTIRNSYATGNVSGSYTVGGLLGDNNFGVVSNSHATGTVTWTNAAPQHEKFGGLMGYNSGTVDSSYATGNVSGDITVGGLAGLNDGGTINNSFARGIVSGYTEIGGLVGSNMAGSSTTSNATITNSYVSGGVTGTGDYVGGLVGINRGGNGSNTTGGTASITNSYATGAVQGGGYVGGLVGLNAGGQGGNMPDAIGGASSIANTYATGHVTSGNFGGGLVGSNTNGDAGYGDSDQNSMMGGAAGGLATIGRSFWNATTSAQDIGIGGSSAQTGVTGLTSSQMTQMASFASWNAAADNTIAKTGASGAVWRIYEGHTAPLLTSLMTGLTLVDAPDVAVTYDGTARSGARSGNQGSPGILGSAATGTNAGFYNGYFSNQQGYDISGGNLTINAAVLSAISLNGTRAYDGTVDVAAGIFTLSGLIGDQHLTLTGSGTVVGKNVGSNKTVTLGTLALGNGSGGLASNYTFVGGTQTASITKANLSVTAAAVTKTYDSTLNASGSATFGTLAGAMAGETVLSNGSMVFLDKNAGTGTKTVRASGVTIKDAGGTDVSANYTIAYTDNSTSTIAKAELTVSGLTAVGKVYDATTNATLAGNASISKLGTDDVALGGSAVGTFASKNAGSRSVTVSGNTLAGLDAGNYNLLQQAGLTATISKADLVVSGLSVVGKVYDATTNTTLAGNASISKFGNDEVTLAGSAVGTFASKNVGSR